MSDELTHVTTTFTCEHNRKGCPLCAEKVFEQAGELTALRKQVEILRGGLEAYAELDNWSADHQTLRINIWSGVGDGDDIAAQALAEADKLEESE